MDKAIDAIASVMDDWMAIRNALTQFWPVEYICFPDCGKGYDEKKFREEALWACLVLKLQLRAVPRKRGGAAKEP